MKTVDSALLHELPLLRGDTTPNGGALTYRDESLPYAELARRILAFSGSLLELGVSRGERVGVYLEKRFETVITCFGATAAGAAFVPINPLLKPEQVGYILGDCNVRVLVTSSQRFAALTQTLAGCTDLRHVIVVDDHTPSAAAASYSLHQWRELSDAPQRLGHRVIDGDMAAILYTSGSTGRPKGVVLSHRNMVIGAKSVASYLENHHEDVLMAALPLSFDAGFSQLTTGFHAGARVVLLNYLLPKDVINTAVRERVTGLTAVPPLYIQLSQLQWPETITDHLRYFANTGGRMPLQTLNRLRTLLPKTKPFLMYGLTEAFRATYLPPEEVERRPDSIGKAIPNAEILVLRDDGSPCAPNEPGELVQRGALVAMGYWGDPEKTAERFKPLPERVVGREAGLVLPEIAVFSGDTVRQDEEGFLYFIGRRDEMIKTSGYRVSPTEIEEALYATQLVGETAAFGVPHPELGHAIVVVVTPPAGRSLTAETLLAACGERLPVYMMPRKVDVRTGPLPRNANGKIDRKLLSGEFNGLFEARSQER
jgi:acyl-CoA ligase (AMP-forming) (exosortase A-associated)